jgi:hypothetical protein
VPLRAGASDDDGHRPGDVPDDAARGDRTGAASGRLDGIGPGLRARRRAARWAGHLRSERPQHHGRGAIPRLPLRRPARDGQASGLVSTLGCVARNAYAAHPIATGVRVVADSGARTRPNILLAGYVFRPESSCLSSGRLGRRATTTLPIPMPWLRTSSRHCSSGGLPSLRRELARREE